MCVIKEQEGVECAKGGVLVCRFVKYWRYYKIVIGNIWCEEVSKTV
jgi:hypothetical protein